MRSSSGGGERGGAASAERGAGGGREGVRLAFRVPVLVPFLFAPIVDVGFFGMMVRESDEENKIWEQGHGRMRYVYRGGVANTKAIEIIPWTVLPEGSRCCTNLHGIGEVRQTCVLC